MKEERKVSGLKKGHSSRRVCCQGEKFSPCPTKAMDRCPKDGEWHSRADEVHRPAVRKLPFVEWKPRRKATKEMHTFPVDSTIGGAHKRHEIRSAISARLSMLCFLGSGSRLEHRTDRPNPRVDSASFLRDTYVTLFGSVKCSVGARLRSSR